MLEEIYKLNPEDVKLIEWDGDHIDYDLQLYRLGNDFSKFMVINPWIDDDNLPNYIEDIPSTNKCIVWKYKDDWVAKYFNGYWTPEIGYEIIELVKPKFTWRKNQDLDRLMTFEGDPFGEFEPEPWDSRYQLVWYIDPRFNPLPDKVWAVSCQPMGRPAEGVKDMGYLTPSVNVEYNTDLPDLGIDIDQCYPAFYDLACECAWELDPIHTPDKRMWVVSITPAYRQPKEWKWYGTVSPQLNIEYNPVLPKLEYDIEYTIPWHDLVYEHVWMLDGKHLQHGETELWAVKASATKHTEGSKVVDYISPTYKIKYNPALPKLEYNTDYVIPWHDLAYEHVWMLDQKHLQNNEEPMWAVKVTASKRQKGIKVIGELSPLVNITYNPDLVGYKFNIDYAIPYHDFAYEHMLMLDKEYSKEYDIWAVKFSVTSSTNIKPLGSITPVVREVRNPALVHIDFNIDYQIPYYDRQYEHVWYLDQTDTQDKIWALRMSATLSPRGEKEMGTIVPLLPELLDVIFISYHESNAEENWERVLEKAPQAKRVDGVKGIFEAHKAAARLSTTDMFYVVDGDAYLMPDWEFDYQPGIFDRDCAYVWHSKNMVNGLVYGYGGVKLFSKAAMLRAKAMTKLDMTTSIMPKLKVMDKVSNITAFNTDEFSTWRSSFRECVKLCYNLTSDPSNLEHHTRLDAWLNNGKNAKFGKYSIQAARQAVDFAEKNKDKYKALLKINDRDWLLEQFNKLG